MTNPRLLFASEKSPVQAFALSLCFGPFGFFYASRLGAIVLLAVYGILLVASSGTLLPLLPVFNIGLAMFATALVDEHNREVRNTYTSLALR